MGDLFLQALLSMLCGALVYLWFLKSCVIPVGSNVFNIKQEFDYNVNIQKQLIDKQNEEKANNNR